ncbi:Thioredoxin-like protein 1, partial [Coemansia sp. RSA 2708]
ATQQIEMTKEIYERGGVVNLRYVRFQNVNSLSIFVADNLGDDDVTAISQLAFIGTAINSANVSDIRQGEEGHSH